MQSLLDEKLLEEKVLKKIENSLKNLRIADLEIFISAAQMKNLGKFCANMNECKILLKV